MRAYWLKLVGQHVTLSALLVYSIWGDLHLLLSQSLPQVSNSYSNCLIPLLYNYSGSGNINVQHLKAIYTEVHVRVLTTRSERFQGII